LRKKSSDGVSVRNGGWGIWGLGTHNDVLDLINRTITHGTTESGDK